MKRISIWLCTLFAVMIMKAADMSNSLELSQLYIIGDATPYAWDVQKAGEMQKVDDGVFRWSGHLEAGKEFKFINTRAFFKHIVATCSGQLVGKGRSYNLNLEISYSLDSSRDLKFKPSATGDYTIYVDLRSMQMALYDEEQAVNLPDKLYATGSALDGKIVEMEVMEGIEYKLADDFKSGSIIFRDTPQPTASTKYYVPLFDGVDITFGKDVKASLKETTNGDVEGWSVAVPGKYTFYLRKDLQLAYAKVFKPFSTLYLVGGCCSAAWNYWDASSRFTPNPSKPEELIWEGYLSPNWNDSRDEPDKLKILTAPDWFSETYHPYVADYPLVGEYNFRTTGSDDFKWIIYDAGMYRVAVNTLAETMKAVKLSNDAKQNGANQSTTAIGSVKEPSLVKVACSRGAVYVKSAVGEVAVSVYTIDGKRMASVPVVMDGIVAEGLSKGIYVVKLIGNTVCLSRKVVMDE